MASVPITAVGFARMQEELKTLKNVERPAIVRAIAEAREHGDLSENAEYHAAREKQGFIEGRISELEGKMASIEVIDIAGLSGDSVTFGATVEIVDCETEKNFRYRIVGEYEADASAGQLSVTAPLARALIGKTVGDIAEVATPGGAKDYEILNVSFET